MAKKILHFSITESHNPYCSHKRKWKFHYMKKQTPWSESEEYIKIYEFYNNIFTELSINVEWG